MAPTSWESAFKRSVISAFEALLLFIVSVVLEDFLGELCLGLAPVSGPIFVDVNTPVPPCGWATGCGADARLIPDVLELDATLLY